MECLILAIPNFFQSFYTRKVSINSECTFFCHSKFIPVFLEKNVEKFGMAIFSHSEFIPVFLGKIAGKNLGQPLYYGHSKFIPVFLGKIVGKNLEQPCLAILNLYQSFWEKLSEKIWNGHFSPFQIYTSLFGKNYQKKKWPFQIYTSLFGKNYQKKFRTAIFGHSKFIPVFL